MRIEKLHRSLSLFEIVLIYFSIAFIWEMIFSPFYSTVDNLGFLASTASAVSIYFVAKLFLKPNFFGRSLKFCDVSQILFISIVTVLLGIGSWAFVVYFDAFLNGSVAMKRWGLISVQDFRELEWSLSWLIGHFIVSSFLAPIMEEIIFRGFILNRLRERNGIIFSIVISSVLFAIFHYNKSFVGAFLHGIIYAILAIKIASLYAPIVVHCLYNATIFVLTTRYGLSVVGDSAILGHFVYWLPELACGIAGCILSITYLIIFPFNFRMGETKEQVKF